MILILIPLASSAVRHHRILVVLDSAHGLHSFGLGIASYGVQVVAALRRCWIHVVHRLHVDDFGYGCI